MARGKVVPIYEKLSPEEAVSYRANLKDIPYWRIDEAALFLGVTKQTIYQMVHDGKLSRVRGHGGPNLISRDAVLELLDNHNQPICEKLGA